MVVTVYKLLIIFIGTLFQIRLHSVQNCIQWTSSDVITSRVEDLENTIVSSLREHCQCEFTRDPIIDGGYQCFASSETHVTFRARLRETDQKDSLELMMYLEDIVVNTRSWLIHGQYLKLNLTCDLLITDIHSPECSQSTSITSGPPLSYNDKTFPTTVIACTEEKITCNVGYLVWALSSSTLLLLLMAAFGISFIAKLLKRKATNLTR